MRHTFLLKIWLFSFFLCAFFLPLTAQSPSTQGREFFAGFMKNGYRSCNGTTASESLRFIASAKRTCDVTVSNPQTGWSDSYVVQGNSLINIVIPPNQVNQVYSTNSEMVENKGLRITSSDTISLFIANEATNSFDASFVLPVSSLLDEYMVQNFVPMIDNNATCPNNNKSVFLIVATEDNTIVDITPKATTAQNKPAGVPFSVTLQRGQSYQVMSSTGNTSGDFSGSRIKARDCKKIAVFNGNVITSVPHTLSNGLDHIFEQAMPVAYWGKEFVVTSSAYRPGGDIVIVTALENNTKVLSNGAPLTTLNAGASYTFPISSVPGSCFLEATGPVAVNLYNTTSTHDGSTLGDPSMVWISPIEQQIKEVVFGTFSAQSINLHYVNIIVKTDDVNSIRLDGGNISSQFSPVTGNSDYSFARVQINAGSHILRSNSGFVAHVYGFGTAQGYAYSVGSSTINLNREIYLNGIPYYQVETDYFICQSDSVEFDFLSNGRYDSIIWDMGDGTRYCQNTSIIHQYADGGTYNILNIIKLASINCAGSLYDTMAMRLLVKPNREIDLYDTICPGEYSNPDWGFALLALRDTVVIDSATTLDDCAIAVLHLKILPIYEHKDTVKLCELELPLHYGDTVINAIGNYLVPFHTVNGCDSTIQLEVIYRGIVQQHYTDTICEGYGSYYKYGFNIQGDTIAKEGIYNFDRYYANEQGCDSSIYLTLVVINPKVTIQMLVEPFCLMHSTVLYAETKLPFVFWNTADSVPVILVNQVGNYIVTAYGYNCFTKDSLIIEKCCPPNDYQFPNVITPSTQDGLNDHFTLPENFMPFKSEIYIYNRWGKLVFKHTEKDGPEFKWDGTENGKIVQGVYYYTLVLNGYCKYHGLITVF